MKYSRFELPSMGEGVFEATVVRWLKEVGTSVKKDEPILEVSTDKVDTEIVAPRDGYLIACFAQPGSVVKVGHLVGQIDSNKDAPILALIEESNQPPTAIKHETPTERTRERTIEISKERAFKQEGQFAGRVRSSPLVRKIAREAGVPLGEVIGTGLHGRITKHDLLMFLSEGAAPLPQKVEREEKLPIERRGEDEFLEGVKIKRQPMDRIRRLTAEHMVRSVRISPHVTTTFSIMMDQALQMQKKQKDSEKNKLTLTAFFVAAAAKALKEHPMVNASIDGTDILLKDDINIGCAVATPQGLMVPVLKGLADMGLEGIAVRLNDTVKRARQKELKPEDITGGTFTITNPGVYGSVHSQPIISQPQVAIMSVGTLEPRLALEKGNVVEHFVLQCGLTFDHRLIDGEGGAKFLKTIKDLMENPESLR